MKQLAISLVALTVNVSAQQLTDTDIQQAIQAGQNKKFSQLVSDCIAKAGFGQSLAGGMAGGVQPTGSFDVVVSGTAGRIAFLAADAKRLYKQFGMDNIGDDLRAPAIFVFVDPQKPNRSSNSIDVASPIDNVVLKSKTKPDVAIQPQKIDMEPVEWSNLLGGKVSANRATAIYSLEEARNLPPGDVDVVVITQAGERRCKVGTGDRKRLFPPNQ